MMDGMMRDGMTAGMGLWMVLFLVTAVALLVLAALGTVSVYRRLRTPRGDVAAVGGRRAAAGAHRVRNLSVGIHCAGYGLV